jgi:hypothetical protein
MATSWTKTAAPFVKGKIMQIEAICHKDGRIEMTTSIRLKHLPAKVRVIVPDELIDSFNNVMDPVITEIHQMLGSDYRYTPSGQSDKEILLGALEEKYCP